MNALSKKQLIQFLGLTFAISWIIWLPGVIFPDFPVSGKTLEILGALGPAVAALVLVARSEGKAGLKRIAVSSFGSNCNWRFLIFASLMLMGIHAASRIIYGLVSDNLPTSEMLASPAGLIPLFILMFLLGGGLNEEIGWRGYALDRLQSKYSALTASLLLGFVWIIWHLPVFFLSGTNQSMIPFWLFMIAVIPLGVMMTWVYNNTGKSIFAAAMFHTIGNLSHELFRIMPTESSSALTGFVILTVLYFVAAIVITGVYGAKTLRRT